MKKKFILRAESWKWKGRIGDMESNVIKENDLKLLQELANILWADILESEEDEE